VKRTLRNQLWFFVAVAILLGAAWWQLHADQQAAPGTLLLLKPDAITHVTLETGRAPAERYIKRGEHWWRIDGGTETRADEQRLEELVRIAAAPVRSWQPAAGYDLAKIGLAPAQAKLELDGEMLRFGIATAIGHNVYVQAGDRIAIVSMQHMPRSAQSQAIQAE
jgi:hypothetical protein